MSRKKITIKDLRKHIVASRKVKGGKIHTVQTPNAGTIEIAEGNSHSKGGVNYIKTSDGVTHEIENNEVILPTEDGPYIVSDYMNVDGSKNYNKKKTSYADLVKHLAMSGATKQDLERVAMETEIANGNDPNNPTSLIKDTNVLQQPTQEYQQTKDRQSKGGKDNLWGNMFGPKRTEVQVGGDDVRLEDKGSLINNQMLEYNISDGDTTGVNQYLYTNQEATRGTSTTTSVEGQEDVTVDNNDQKTYNDELKYNIVNGELVITDKGGNIHENVTQVSKPNRPSIFKNDLKGGNVVRTNTSVTPDWTYGNIHIGEINGVYTLGGDGSNEKESVNTFRNWMSVNYPDWESDGEGLDKTGPMNGYVTKALKQYGEEFSNAFEMEPTTTTTDESMSTSEINKLLKKNYQQPYKYKGGGKLIRKYQETNFETSFKGDVTNIPTDFKFDWDENLSPIIEDDGSYTPQTNWTHKDDKTPNVQPTGAEFREKGFNNATEWRTWVNKQNRFGSYDWGNLDYWGPKHQEAWKAMGSPPPPEEKSSTNCVGGGCYDSSSFSSNEKINKKFEEGGDDNKINWKKWGMLGLGGLAAFGAYKAIAGAMGQSDDMLEEAKGEKGNMIGKQQLGKVDLQRISHRTQITDAMQRGQSMDNQVEYMNIPEAGKYLLKERNTIKTQGEINKIKEAENNVNVGISVKEGS